MQSLRRTAVTAARKGQTTLPRQPRRFAHDEHAHGHGHASAKEPIGTGLWIPLAAIPIGWALYYVSRSDDPSAPPLFTRLINQYTESQDKLAAKNDIHVQMIEKAGSERVLFVNTKPQEYVPVRFPEMIYAGSPYNVPAGSQVDLDKLMAKYKQEAYDDNERKHEALRSGNIKGEQPFERFPGPSPENKKWPN